MAAKLKNGKTNLRGQRVAFAYGGHLLRGTVVTHLRDDLWQVQCGALPFVFTSRSGGRRITLHRRDFEIVASEQKAA